MAALPKRQLRAIQRVLPRPSPHWVGDGFRVYPVFSNLAFSEELSPLLMFDYAEPHTFPPRPAGTKPLGVGQHPHRGFQTVTLAFQGEVEHHDSTGQSDVIHKGDVQWMNAGRGIIHQEYHSKAFTQTGGTFEMCQLWVNLPKAQKMSPPGYQAIPNATIPVVQLPSTGGTGEDDNPFATARIIAGDLQDTKGAATTVSPVQLWDISLPSTVGSVIDMPYPKDHTCIVFVRRGSVEIMISEDGKGRKLHAQEVALMQTNGGDVVRFRVVEPDSSLLILGGEPLNEPIAAQGPFVMNTKEEIREAIMDYQMGRMGR